MKKDLSKVNKNKVDKKTWTWFILLSFLARPIHEFGHWIAYKIYGIDVYFTLNQVVPKEISNFKLLGEAGGPLINISLVLIGFWIIKRTKFNDFGIALIITNSLTRLVPYLIMALTDSWESNDEGIVASVLNLNIYSLYIILSIFFILAIIVCFKISFQNLKKQHIKSLIFMFLIFTFIILILEIPQDTFFKNYRFDLDQAIRYMQKK